MKKFLIVLAVLCLAAPTMAAEWNFYGSSRFATWSDDFDPDTGADSERNTTWDMQANSRIGATVKFDDQIGGAFEYGHSSASGGVTLRQLYGTYNFGVGQFLIGQTYTPASSYFYSNSVYATDNNMLGIGQFYVGRVPMVQLKFGDLKLAFVKVNDGIPTSKPWLDPAVYGVAPWELDPASGKIEPTDGYDVQRTLPKIEASYRFKGEMFFVDVYGGWQSYELQSVDGPAEYDVDSYVVGIGGGLTFGPAFLKAGWHMGDNLGNYGLAAALLSLNNAARIVGDRIEDQEGMGYLGVLGFKANDMLTVEAGYGRQESEVDAINYEADVTQYYLNATINFHKNFFVVPEIGMVEQSVDGVPAEPEIFYVGAKWQINF